MEFSPLEVSLADAIHNFQMSGNYLDLRNWRSFEKMKDIDLAFDIKF